jgi:serine/threonine protein kinase
MYIVGCHYQSSSDYCGDVNMLYIMVEFISNNILKDIHQRKQKKYIYTEPEIWYLIKSVIDALLFYNSQGIEYFDLHPSNVRLNDNGIVKLVKKFNIKMDLSLHE